MTQTHKVTRALISVYDKTGLPELAQGLHDAGVKIVSTGSTAANIAALGIPVTEVKDVTGFPESLDGRVKTLHPKIHGGLLADIRKPEHVAQLSELGFEAFLLPHPTAGISLSSQFLLRLVSFSPAQAQPPKLNFPASGVIPLAPTAERGSISCLITKAPGRRLPSSGRGVLSNGFSFAFSIIYFSG
jgi:hypothetical protein